MYFVFIMTSPFISPLQVYKLCHFYISYIFLRDGCIVLLSNNNGPNKLILVLLLLTETSVQHATLHHTETKERFILSKWLAFGGGTTHKTGSIFQIRRSK